MSGPQFQGQPSQGIPRGSIPQNVPQGFQPRQGSPSTSDGSQSLGESRSTTQPPSQQQTPQHQNDPYEARSVGRAPFHGQPSQPYTSSSFPQIPQQQMQGTGSSLPQRQWRHQGHPGKNFVRTPQQQMQPPVHQAGPPSESTSATSEEDSDDDDSSESDDDEDEEGEEDNEDGFPTTGNHPGWPQQVQAPVISPQQPRAASLMSSLSGASTSTARQSQPVGQIHPKVSPSIASALSGATGSTADRSVRQEKAPSTASSTVATTLSGATSRPLRASQYAKERQRQYTPTSGERQVLGEDERTIPHQEHSLYNAPARPASLASTSHRGSERSLREHSLAPNSPNTHGNRGVYQPQYPPSLKEPTQSSNHRGSQTSGRTNQRLRNQPLSGTAPPLSLPKTANRGEADAYYDPNQTFSSCHSAPSTRNSFRPNGSISYKNHSYQKDSGPSNPHNLPSSPPPPTPPPPTHGLQLLPSRPTNPPKPPNPDPFAHILPPGWKATLKGFVRLYLHQRLHHDDHPSQSTGFPPTTATAAAAAMRAEKYELFLRGQRFFQHPVIRLCGNFRRRHYVVIAERVEEVRRAVLQDQGGSDEDTDVGGTRQRAGVESRRTQGRRRRGSREGDGGEGGGSPGQFSRRGRQGGFRHTGGE